MPSTYTSNNKIQKIATGEQSGTWGSTTNTNFDLFDTAIDGSVTVALSGTTQTLNIPDGAAGDGRNKVLIFTGSLAGTNTVTVTPNTVKKHYFVQNNTTGGQNIVISQGSGSSVTVKPGYSSIVYLDGAGSGAAVKEVLTSLKLTALLEATGAVFVGSSSGTTTLQSAAAASGTLTLPAATDTLVGKATTDTFTNKTFDTAGTGNVLRINGTQVSAVTGSGSVVLATSPTLVTPLLGTPTSGTLTNCTGLPISTGVSGLSANMSTFLATASSANLAATVTDETGSGSLVFANTPVLVSPVLGTPTSGTLTNCTGLPISTGVSGLAANVATFLATPSSANLAAALTDETGTGANVFANTPSLITPAIGSGGFTVAGSSSGTTTVVATAAASGTITIPAATDTLVGKATTDTLTNKTFDTAGTGNVLKINGTQVSAVTGSGSVVLATSPTLVTPLLGTPTSGTLTNCTGLPVSTGISGLGTGVATFLATPSSANLASAVTDETGSGALVFGTSPTIATPTITTSAVIPLINGGTTASSTLTLQSTSGAGTSDAIIFKTASQSEAMRITTGGNVGIGTASPQTLLTVGSYLAGTGEATNRGYIQIQDPFSSSTIDGSRGLEFKSSPAGSGYGYKIGTVSDVNLAIGYRANSATFVERMRIDSSGNVGIGTSSPGAGVRLEVDGGLGRFTTYGSSAAVLSRRMNGTASVPTALLNGEPIGGILMQGYDGTAVTTGKSGMTGLASENWSSTACGSYLIFETTANTTTTRAERMRIDNSGNVGIGTASPGAILHTYGAGQTTAAMSTSTSQGGSIKIQDSGASAGNGGAVVFGSIYGFFAAIKSLIISGSSNTRGDLAFSVRNNDADATLTESMRINSDGYLLVGYTSSQGSGYKLQVNSQIFATNNIIATSDRRYKQNITPLQSGLDLVGKLNPVTFDWKKHDVHDFEEGTQVGFIAQEVQQVLADTSYSDAVIKRNELKREDGSVEEFYGMADAKLIPILVKAIQELKTEIDLLKSRN